jgi:hypothetical protein
MVRWWWPGGDVTDEELRREVRLLDEANFGGGEIQPFTIGLSPKMSPDALKRVNDYLTPAFFAHVNAALAEAQSRGMWLDYTFGSGWPFGGGQAITPELASIELRYAHQSLRGPSHFHDKPQAPKPAPGMGGMIARMSGFPDEIPEGWKDRLKRREKLVAVVAVRGTEAQAGPQLLGFIPDPMGNVKKTGTLDASTAVVLTSRLDAQGYLDWEVPRGEWQLFTFMQFPADLRVIGGAGGGPQLVLDHLSRRAFEAHTRRVGDTFKSHSGQFFGNGLRALFCDSLEVQAYLYWTEGFLDEFQKRRGYDLTPFLPILKVPGFSDPYGSYKSAPLYDMEGVGFRVRNDYWQTVSDMMIENFYQPFANWGQKNNVLSRVQAHGAPADVERIYGLSSIPETEDLYDGGRHDFLKLAASSAHVYGRKIASSESFVWMGKAYQTTPEKIKRYADELITAGINEIIYHGFPYEYMDRPEPGWHPFASPLPFSSHMNHHNPFWPYIPRLNAYMTRLQYLSQEGTNVAPVAVYRQQLSYDSIQPLPPEPEINTKLMNAGYNFDHINSDALEKSHVENGRLVTPGGARYGALILLNEDYVRLELAEKLAAFRAAHLPVIFVGAVPEGEAGLTDHAAKSARIDELMKGARAVQSPEAAVAELGRVVQPNLKFSVASVPFIEKRLGEVDAFFLRNPDPEEKRLEVVFPAQASPQLWDAWTGEISPLTNFDRRDNTVRVHLALEPYGSRLIVFDPAVHHEPARTPERTSPVISAVGQKGWELEAGGKEYELAELIDWSKHPDLKTFAGRGRYTTELEVSPRARHITLDLGSVGDVAEVSVNGTAIPALMLRPYRADITTLAHPGANKLVIVVTNTLYNSLSARTATLPIPGLPKASVMPSGLMGPVTIEVSQ